MALKILRVVVSAAGTRGCAWCIWSIGRAFGALVVLLLRCLWLWLVVSVVGRVWVLAVSALGAVSLLGVWVVVGVVGPTNGSVGLVTLWWSSALIGSHVEDGVICSFW